MHDRVAVIIPCFRVKNHILSVISSIGPEVSDIIVVDDLCPEESGKFVEANVRDPRVRVTYHTSNMGVGGATKTGYDYAVDLGATVLIKMDGDGQMDPRNIKALIVPILSGDADYCKGNRFHSPTALKGMPFVRLFGNGVLSFLTKFSTGYWKLMDPTNGFTAIHARVYGVLEPQKIDNRYFFETDILYRLHLVGAVVRDIPMASIYGSEKSNLRISRQLFTFAKKHIVRVCKRILYDYFIHDFNVGSAQLFFGALCFFYGLFFGLYLWFSGMVTGQSAELGTIMFSVIPLIIGFQLLLSALNYDISSQETSPIQRLFRKPDEA